MLIHKHCLMLCYSFAQLVFAHVVKRWHCPYDFTAFARQALFSTFVEPTTTSSCHCVNFSGFGRIGDQLERLQSLQEFFARVGIIGRQLFIYM